MAPPSKVTSLKSLMHLQKLNNSYNFSQYSQITIHSFFCSQSPLVVKKYRKLFRDNSEASKKLRASTKRFSHEVTEKMRRDCSENLNRNKTFHASINVGTFCIFKYLIFKLYCKVLEMVE